MINEGIDMLNSAAILGGGSWGTAVAAKVARKISNTTIYLRQNDIIEEINLVHRKGVKTRNDNRQPLRLAYTSILRRNQISVLVSERK